MAQYKVIQDIEAEDKLVGPLSLRQFIYAIVVIALGFIGFQLGRVNFILAIPMLPPMLFFGLLAAPIGQAQSSEVWLLGKFRYWIFPRKRFWDQSGQMELVKITAPKYVEKHLTKDFDKEEARSRLKALANTLDTRGWAIKNVSADMFQRSSNFATQQESDRLVDISSIPKDAVETEPSSDLLDPTTSPVAAKMDTMITASSSTHRQELLNKVQQMAASQNATDAQPQPAVAAPPPPQAQTQVPTPPVTRQNNVFHPQPQADEPEPSKPQPIITHQKQETPAPQPPEPQTQKQPQAPMTSTANTDILENVKNDGRSLNVQGDTTKGQDSDEEVVISLH